MTSSVCFVIREFDPQHGQLSPQGQMTTIVETPMEALRIANQLSPYVVPTMAHRSYPTREGLITRPSET